MRELAGIAATTWSFWPAARKSRKRGWPFETFRQLAAGASATAAGHRAAASERFEEVAELLATSGFALAAADAAGSLSRLRLPRARVLLVDAVGELGAWWGTAQIAFVGGSMGNRGGQNMIEPAAYGAAVSFGPNTRNFRDIVAAMLAGEAAVVVQDGDELTAFVARCLDEPQFADRLGARARR